MITIRVRALRWVSDDPQPGIVECRLIDADGVEHVLVDKSAIFDDANLLRSDAEYPIDLDIECTVLREDEHGGFVALAHQIESVEGQHTFRVLEGSLGRAKSRGVTTPGTRELWHSRYCENTVT